MTGSPFIINYSLSSHRPNIENSFDTTNTSENLVHSQQIE